MATKTVTLTKDSHNMIGISIGGGAPHCPCLYVVQVFDDTPAAREGTLAAGDELVAVNKMNIRGMARSKLASLIQSFTGKVSITLKKLILSVKPTYSMDMHLKILKHRMVETMSQTTADTLGLSRAILVNDCMVKKMYELSELGNIFYGLMALLNKYLKDIYHLSRVYRAFGEVFAEIGVLETQAKISDAFTMFAEAHRNMEKCAFTMLQKIKPLVDGFKTFIQKVIPDTRLTVKRYLDMKFEYLSYCLKVKEMDDEEYDMLRISETLSRTETGNYDYRCYLRHRQDSRKQFALLRNDVFIKIELVDNKHVQDMSKQLGLLIAAISEYQSLCQNSINRLSTLFPFEVDLAALLSAQELVERKEFHDILDSDEDVDDLSPDE